MLLIGTSSFYQARGQNMQSIYEIDLNQVLPKAKSIIIIDSFVCSPRIETCGPNGLRLYHKSEQQFKKNHLTKYIDYSIYYSNKADITEFDSFGNKIKFSNVKNDTTLSSENWERTYHNAKLTYTGFYENGSFIWHESMLYDSLDRLTQINKKGQKFNYKTTYEYDTYGNLINENITLSPNYIQLKEWRYDTLNRLIFRKYSGFGAPRHFQNEFDHESHFSYPIEKNQTDLTYIDWDSSINYTSWTYNKKELLISMKCFDKNKILTDQMLKEYDANGQIASEIHLTENHDTRYIKKYYRNFEGRLDSVRYIEPKKQTQTHVEYTYDTLGNWILQQEFRIYNLNNQRTLTRVIHRKIEY